MTIRLHWRKHSAGTEHRILRWAEYFFFLAGCLALGFCALSYIQARRFQISESQRLEVARETARAPSRLAPSPPQVVSKPPRSAAREGSPVSRLEIPRLGLSVMVVEGVRSRNLRLGAGHIPGTAFPDESGNVGIAGHRDTYFRKLREVRMNDVITLTTVSGSYQYSVEWKGVVAATTLEVIQPSRDPILTLVTCYPFYYVGPAPDRFIVRARQISGPPEALAAP